MKQENIKARRVKVSYYIVKGTPEDQIAEILGVHRNTVVRDVAYLKKSAKNWLDDLAKDGFLHEYRLGLEKVKDHEYELQKILLYAETVGQKIQIIKALNENTKLYLELLGETPTVHAYKQALNKFQQSKNTRITQSMVKKTRSRG